MLSPLWPGQAGEEGGEPGEAGLHQELGVLGPGLGEDAVGRALQARPVPVVDHAEHGEVPRALLVALDGVGDLRRVAGQVDGLLGDALEGLHVGQGVAPVLLDVQGGDELLRVQGLVVLGDPVLREALVLAAAAQARERVEEGGVADGREGLQVEDPEVGVRPRRAVVLPAEVLAPVGPVGVQDLLGDGVAGVVGDLPGRDALEGVQEVVEEPEHLVLAQRAHPREARHVVQDAVPDVADAAQAGLEPGPVEGPLAVDQGAPEGVLQAARLRLQADEDAVLVHGGAAPLPEAGLALAQVPDDLRGGGVRLQEEGLGPAAHEVDAEGVAGAQVLDQGVEVAPDGVQLLVGRELALAGEDLGHGEDVAVALEDVGVALVGDEVQPVEGVGEALGALDVPDQFLVNHETLLRRAASRQGLKRRARKMISR